MRSTSAVCVLLFVCLSTSTGCGVFGGLTSDQRDQLKFFKQNAGVYFLGERYEQALDMTRKGLEIDPDDYDLLVTAGLSNLQRAGEDTVALQQAEADLDAAFAQRRFEDNRPEAILGYATVKQRLGRAHQRRAEVLSAELKRTDLSPNDRVTRESQAREHAVRSLSYWNDAKRALNVLIDRQELLRFAHKQLTEVAAETNDYESAVKHGDACLAENRKAQDRANRVIKETLDASEEIDRRAELQELLDQEKRVRAGLAEMHFRKQAYEPAVVHLDALLALDPTRSNDYYNRARALERLNRKDEARRDFEKFLYTTTLPASDDRVAHAERSTQRR